MNKTNGSRGQRIVCGEPNGERAQRVEDSDDGWYLDEEGLTENGEFDWESVLDAIVVEERDEYLWGWFRAQAD